MANQHAYQPITEKQWNDAYAADKGRGACFPFNIGTSPYQARLDLLISKTEEKMRTERNIPDFAIKRGSVFYSNTEKAFIKLLQTNHITSNNINVTIENFSGKFTARLSKVAIFKPAVLAHLHHNGGGNQSLNLS